MYKLVLSLQSVSTKNVCPLTIKATPWLHKVQIMKNAESCMNFSIVLSNSTTIQKDEKILFKLGLFDNMF